MDKCDGDEKGVQKTFIVRFGNEENAKKFENMYSTALNENLNFIREEGDVQVVRIKFIIYQKLIKTF